MSTTRQSPPFSESYHTLESCSWSYSPPFPYPALAPPNSFLARLSRTRLLDSGIFHAIFSFLILRPSLSIITSVPSLVLSIKRSLYLHPETMPYLIVLSSSLHRSLTHHHFFPPSPDPPHSSYRGPASAGSGEQRSVFACACHRACAVFMSGPAAVEPRMA